ncbi:MAG: flagellar biosynthetic protein FliR [Ignavibacteriales bacterium]
MTLDLLVSRFPVLLLIFVRFSGLFATAPVLSSRYIPVQVRAMASVFLAVFTLPFVKPVEIPGNVAGLALYAVNELAVGLSVGYVASVVLSAIQVAGQLIDTEIGFGMVNVLDPQYGTPVPLFGNFYYLTALMFLIGAGGDRMIVAALIQSYGSIPPGAVISAPAPAFMSGLVGAVFTTALKIAAPLLGSLFMVTLALGIVARAVPQMNVFMVGMPVKLVAGLVVLAATFSLLPGLLEGLAGDMLRAIQGTIGLLAP